VVKDMAGIKSNHCFVTAGGFIYMFPTSCTCPPCRGMEYEKCELVASRDRGVGKRMELKAFIPAIQEKRSNFSSTLERGWAVLAECRVLQRMYINMSENMVANGGHEKISIGRVLVSVSTPPWILKRTSYGPRPLLIHTRKICKCTRTSWTIQ